MMMTKGDGDNRPPKSGPRAATADEARERQRAIGDGLKRLFSDVVDEPVPDDFLKLLEEAETASKKAKDDG